MILKKNIQSDIRLFADDTYLFDISRNIEESIVNLNQDLISLENWAEQWRVSFNPSKTVYMYFTRNQNIPHHSPLLFQQTPLQCVENHKHLGVILDKTLKWEKHISYVIEKVSYRLNCMRRLQNTVPRKCLETVYKCMIRPVIDYGDVLFPVLTSNQAQRLESLQRQAALICTKAYQRTPHIFLLNELGWESLETRRKYHCLVIMYKIQNKLSPTYLSKLCPVKRMLNAYGLRNVNDLTQIYCRYSSFRKSFFPETVASWNKLDINVREVATLTGFKRNLKADLLCTTNKLYSYCDGRAAINHTRLRLGLSGLNGHRSLYNFITFSSCPKCDYELEDVEHYLLFCPRYTAHRETLLNTLDTTYGNNFHRK